MKRIMTGFLLIMLVSSAASAAKIPEGSLLQGLEAGPDGKIDVLTVFAHPDDETLTGGTLLMLRKHDPRVRIHILCLTLGDKSLIKDRLDISSEHLAGIRSEELKSAAAVYRAEGVFQLNYHDQGLEAADREGLIKEIREVIDRVSAEVVITFDPPGIYLHPDHVACSRAATEAFKRSRAKRLYYSTLPESRYNFEMKMASAAFKWAFPDLTLDRSLKPVPPTLKVDVREVKKLKELAVYSHASQTHISLDGKIGGIMMRGADYEYFALAVENEQAMN